MLFVLNEAPESSSLLERPSLLITLECGFFRKCELQLYFPSKDQEIYAVMKAFSVMLDFLRLLKHFYSKELE